jgi:hypothetical protein
MRAKSIVFQICKVLLLVIVGVVVIVWIAFSRKVVELSLGDGVHCRWQLHQWYSGRCVLLCYEHGARKGIVQADKGLFQWPLAAFPGSEKHTIIPVYVLDNTIAVFVIDLKQYNADGIAPPSTLSTTVLFSSFKTRACTKAEVAYLKQLVSDSHELSKNTFALNDPRKDLATLKLRLLKAIELGTKPNEERVGEEHYEAQPQIRPAN